MLSHISGVIFDLDGTLVDSKLDFPAMRRETGCPEGTGLLEYLNSLPDAGERRRVEETIHRHEMKGAASATWMPGAKDLLHKLVADGIPTGIVTRNSGEAAMLTLRSLRAPAIDLVAREDAPPKPDPAGLLLLAMRWRLPKASLIYVGDFLFDLQAAANAGMMSALYANHRNDDYAGQADLLFQHFDELASALFPTPP